MNIVTAHFYGAELYGFERPDGVYVALKPIVEHIGLDWSAQLRRVKRDPVLSEGMAMMTIPFVQGEQEAVCLRLDLLNGWLFGIDVSRVIEAKRETVTRYQRECYRVLAVHFFGPPRHGGAIAVGDAKAEPVAIRRALVTEARQTFSTLSARELWFSLGLPTVPSMSAHAGQGELFGGSNAN